MIRSPNEREYRDPVAELTNNPKYKNFEDRFRKTENNRIKDTLKNKVGQSERAVLPVSAVQGGPILMYSNLNNKSPLERKKFIADKIVEDSHQKLKMRVISYRNMLKSPEVSEIISNVTNEAITDNGNGKIISLGIDDNYPGIAIGDGTKATLQQDFNFVMQSIFDFNSVAKETFEKFLIEGAQFWEVVYNEEKNKIEGVNHLPSYNMLVIVDEGVVVGFRQILDNEYGGINMNRKIATNGTYSYIDYHVNQILWWDYRSWGLGGINDRMSYLEPAKKYVNILDNLENAYAKYIIVRGQEKRIYYISTGKMTSIKAEEHMQRQAKALNSKLFFDGDNGTIMGSERISAMTEDLFIPVPDGSTPSKVDTLPAGVNVGEITPLNYFREKIYQALKYPRSRSRMNTQQGQSYSIGKPGEIDVEQITLTKFIESMQFSFGKTLIDLFIMYLETRVEYSEAIKDPKLFRVCFEQSNVFKLIKESEMLNLRLDLLAKAQPFIADHTGGPNDLLAKELVLKRYAMMSDEEYSLNEQYKDKEFLRKLRDKERLDELNKQAKTLDVPDDNADTIGGMGGGGMGGDFGGGGMGDMGGDLGGDLPPEGAPTGEEAPIDAPPEELPELNIPEENPKK